MEFTENYPREGGICPHEGGKFTLARAGFTLARAAFTLASAKLGWWVYVLHCVRFGYPVNWLPVDSRDRYRDPFAFVSAHQCVRLSNTRPMNISQDCKTAVNTKWPYTVPTSKSAGHTYICMHVCARLNTYTHHWMHVRNTLDWTLQMNTIRTHQG